MSQVYVEIEGLDKLGFLPEITENVEKALMRALNKTATHTRTQADRMIRSQVNFPASYLRPNATPRRLWVSQKASRSRFEAKISARGRATSLARFTKQKPLPPGKRHKGGKINVRVKAGGTPQAIERAFLMNLRSGNIGLAVRTDGSKPRGAYKPKEIGKNLWLLYGPSVDQILVAATDGGGVVEQMTPATLAFLEREFNRQLDLLGAT